MRRRSFVARVSRKRMRSRRSRISLRSSRLQGLQGCFCQNEPNQTRRESCQNEPIDGLVLCPFHVPVIATLRGSTTPRRARAICDCMHSTLFRHCYFIVPALWRFWFRFAVQRHKPSAIVNFLSHFFLIVFPCPSAVAHVSRRRNPREAAAGLRCAPSGLRFIFSAPPQDQEPRLSTTRFPPRRANPTATVCTEEPSAAGAQQAGKFRCRARLFLELPSGDQVVELTQARLPIRR